MTRLLLVILSLAVLGCSTTPKQDIEPAAYQVEGWVSIPKPLFKTAEVELTIFSVVRGKPLKVARQEFSVSILPLAYSFSISPSSYGEGQLFLQAKMKWPNQQAVQAEYQARLNARVLHDEHAVKLTPRECFPHCV